MIAVFYRAPDGSEPVRDYIEALDEEKQAILDNQIELLNMFEQIPYPHSSQVEGALRELRCHYGPELYRIYYRRREQFHVLLHIIRKSSAKLPAGDTQIAKDRWNDLDARMTADPRKPPRAFGRDAP